MTWEFKPGMKVVCLQSFNGNKLSHTIIVPKVGEIYTIRDIHPGTLPEQIDKVFLRLDEIVNAIFQYKEGIQEASFWADKFRPLQTQFTNLLNSIVAGVNGDKLVVEDDKYMKNYRRKKQNV